jgi:hypothetical protein
MYPEDRVLELEERLHIGEGLVKTIFIHSFMDEHTFEVDRIKKCCTHYALPDGRLIPEAAHQETNHVPQDEPYIIDGSKGLIGRQVELPDSPGGNDHDREHIGRHQSEENAIDRRAKQNPSPCFTGCN